MKLPAVRYAPDLDPTIPGVITDGNAFIPTVRGIAGAPAAVDALLPPLESACIGAASLFKLDGTQRFIAATSEKIFEATSASAWTERTASGGGNPVTRRWCFTQFGDTSLSASKENFIGISTTGDFDRHPSGGSIYADIIETVGLFVMAFNTNDPSPGVNLYGDRKDSWWCCAVADVTDWTPSITTQCATGRLTSIPGPIVAGKRFGEQIVAYKERGMYLGTYVGPPAIWAWDEIQSTTGTWCQESVVNIGSPEAPYQFFVGRDNFYVFDGSRPRAVGELVKESFFAELNMSEARQICVSVDSGRSLVRIYYPSGSSTVLDSCLIWNFVTGQWGADDREVEFAVEYVNPSITYGDLGTYYATYGDLPNKTYGRAFLTDTNGTPSVFDTDHQLQLLNGAHAGGYFVTGDYGDDVNYNFLSRIKPTWLQKPTAALVTCYNRASLGDGLSVGPQTTMENSRFDVRTSARWHRVKIESEGDWELNKFDVEFAPGGKE